MQNTDRNATSRRILRAEILSIGSELTAGETRDTNSGELARSLTASGVSVVHMHALPDDLPTVRDAFATGLGEADLVVSTGGLGPTPDDLTREAIADVCGERPTVDPDLENWLRTLWARRGVAFPERNLKQAWLIPSAEALANPNGTAPGWFVERPGGGVIVALPGPPREMRPMWQDLALPRLRARGLGDETAVRTLRLTGIGESQVADLLGDERLHASNPLIATYARAEAVDVRISAVARDGRSADAIVDEAEASVAALFGEFVWAHGETTWADAIGDALAAARLSLAEVEIGTAGSFAALMTGVAGLRLAEFRDAETDDDAADEPGDREGERLGTLVAAAERVRSAAGAEVGVAIAAREAGRDTTVRIAVATPWGAHEERHVAFIGGDQGRHRAALFAAALVLGELRRRPEAGG